MNAVVQYSIIVYLKSGKVLASDPVLAYEQDVDKQLAQFRLILDAANSKGTVYIVRAQRGVLIPILSVDYVEFVKDAVDDGETEDAPPA